MRLAIPVLLAIFAHSGTSQVSPWSVAQTAWHVDAAAAPGGNGTSASPFQRIQDAIDAALPFGFDTVIVHPGTYGEAIDFKNKRISLLGLGGANVTHIVAPCCSTSVVTMTGPVHWTPVEMSLTGFTITGGDTQEGGGIYIEGVSPLIEDCAIVLNNALVGGGVYAENSSARFVGCTISENSVPFNGCVAPGFGGFGGGIYCDSTTNIVLSNCSIGGNFAIHQAGGVWNATLLDCTVGGNRSTVAGGIYLSDATNCLITSNVGVSCDLSGSDYAGGALNSTLTDCIIENNLGGFDGGGAHSSVLVRCIVRGNMAFGGEQGGGKGGGAFGSTLIDCEVYGNEAEGSGFPFEEGEGGGVWGVSAVGTVIYENTSGLGSGAFSSDLDRCVVFGNNGDGVQLGFATNSIIVANAGTQIVNALAVTHCNVQGGYPGTGNIDEDPLFWDPITGSFYLQAASPCIDAGDPNSSLDPDGSIADMGAFPFDPDYCPPVTSYCTAGTTANGCNALISATGTPSSTAASGFDVAVTGLEGEKDGIIFWGQVSQASPWGGGTSYLCIEPPVKRTGTQSSGGTTGLCDGTFALDFNSWMAAYPNKAPAVGEVVYMQAWFRDPSSPKGTSLSDGLRFVICP